LHPIVKRTVSRAERLTAYVLGIALVLVAVAATPFMSKPFPPLPGFLLIYSTGLFMLDMMVALLLLSKARIEDNRGHLLLAVAYLYAGFIIIPHLATFPGVFTAGMLAGVSGSATWLWVFWHGGFAALIAAYALLSGKVTAGAPGYLAPLATALLLVVARDPVFHRVGRQRHGRGRIPAQHRGPHRGPRHLPPAQCRRIVADRRHGRRLRGCLAHPRRRWPVHARLVLRPGLRRQHRDRAVHLAVERRAADLWLGRRRQ
jgi:hypothetical protein